MTAKTAGAGLFSFLERFVKLTARQRDAMVWLGEPAKPATLVTEAMLQDLASLAIIEYDPNTGNPKFTKAGAQAYRDTVGHWPNRNI